MLLNKENNHRDKKGEGSRDCLEDWRNTKVFSYEKAVRLLIVVRSRTFLLFDRPAPGLMLLFGNGLERKKKKKRRLLSPVLTPSPLPLRYDRRC